MSNAIKRMLDSESIGRAKRQEWLGLRLIPLGILLSGLVGGTAAAVLSFPLGWQIVAALGGFGCGIALGETAWRRSRLRASKRVRAGLHALHEELSTIGLRLESQVVDGKDLTFAFYLPGEEFAAHNEVLNDRTRQVLGEIYMEADHWNELGDPENGMELTDAQAHALENFRKSVVYAKALVKDDLRKLGAGGT